ncbi:MAG: MBL fold metallo-hydrolase [Phycisphaerales bacterium]
MRFAFLGSGSRGNALVVESGGTRVLVDCGFSAADMQRRLARLSLDPASLDAILITHEHGDHVRGLARFAGRHGLPVWMTPGTRQACAPGPELSVRCFSPHEAFVIDDLSIMPFPVPHDAREPCQFVLSDGHRRLGVLSDIGRSTPHVRTMVDACDALLLECNHDPALLAAGPYPASVRARVSGDLGHLSNGQAAALLGTIGRERLQHVVATHISSNNNTADHARQALADVLGCTRDWVAAADQQEGLSWRSIVAL